MQRRYDGLPAAASVEQAIIMAQLLILRDLQQGHRASGDVRPERVSQPGMSWKRSG